MDGCSLRDKGRTMQTYARHQPQRKVQLQSWLSPPIRRQHIFSSSSSSSALSSSLDQQDSTDSDFQPAAKKLRKKSVAAPRSVCPQSGIKTRNVAKYRQGKKALKAKKKTKCGSRPPIQLKQKEGAISEDLSNKHQEPEDMRQTGKENWISGPKRSHINCTPLRTFITTRRKVGLFANSGLFSSEERSASSYRKVSLVPISRPLRSEKRQDSLREVSLRPDSSSSSADFEVLRRKPWTRRQAQNASSTLVSAINSGKMTSPQRGSIRKPPLLSSTPNVTPRPRKYLATSSAGSVSLFADEGVLNSHQHSFEHETDVSSQRSSHLLCCQPASPVRKNTLLAPYSSDVPSAIFSDSKSAIYMSHSTHGKSCTRPIMQNNVQKTSSILCISSELFSPTPDSPNNSATRNPSCFDHIALEVFQRNSLLQPVVRLDYGAVNRYMRTSNGLPHTRERKRRQSLACSMQGKRSRESPNISGELTGLQLNTVESKPLLDISNNREVERLGSGHLHTWRGEDSEGEAREASCGKTLCSSGAEGNIISVVPLCSFEKEMDAPSHQMFNEQKGEKMVSPPFVSNILEKGSCAMLPPEISLGIGTGRKVCISGFSSKRWGNRTRTANVTVNHNKKTCHQLLFRNQHSDSSLLEYSLGRRKHKEKEVIVSLGLGDSIGTLESVRSADLLDDSFLNSSVVQNLSDDSSFLKDSQRYARLRAAFSLHKKKKVETEAQTAYQGVACAIPATPLTPFSHRNPLGILQTPVGQRLALNPRLGTSSMALLSPLSNVSLSGEVITDAEKVYEECMQDGPISFSRCLSPDKMNQCVKIGEGVFGEVFRTVSNRETVALKIIPIEGNKKVNDEPQKTFGEILPEIIISKELSLLCEVGENVAVGFIKLHSVHCVKGSYPKRLLQAWDTYDDEKGSDNDRPDFFGKDQLFIILEFEFGGRDLENIKDELPSVLSAKTILHQVTAALAVAEEALCFEHRDLHWGNILVKTTDIRTIEYKLKGSNFQIPTHNIEANIIDYTLSRLEKDGLTVFCDLSDDKELFQGAGDYQFDIYRSMKQENGNTWGGYHPHSNVLWLHYVADKLIKEMTFKKKATTPALKSIHRKLLEFHREVLKFPSAGEVLLKSRLFK